MTTAHDGTHHAQALEEILEYSDTIIAARPRRKAQAVAAVGHLAHAIDALAAVIRCAIEQHTETANELDTLRSMYRERITEAAAADRTIGGLERGLHRAEQDLRAARNELRARSNSLDDLRTLRNVDLAALREQGERLTEAETRIENETRSRRHYEAAMQTAESHVRAATNKLEQVEGMYVDAAAANVELTERISALETVLRSYEARLDGERMAHDNARQNLSDALIEIGRLTERHERLTRHEEILDGVRDGDVVELGGVKMQACDEYGRTDTDRALAAAAERIADLEARPTAEVVQAAARILADRADTAEQHTHTPDTGAHTR